jgi:hypothetical protein
MPTHATPPHDAWLSFFTTYSRPATRGLLTINRMFLSNEKCSKFSENDQATFTHQPPECAIQAEWLIAITKAEQLVWRTLSKCRQNASSQMPYYLL